MMIEDSEKCDHKYEIKQYAGSVPLSGSSWESPPFADDLLGQTQHSKRTTYSGGSKKALVKVIDSRHWPLRQLAEEAEEFLLKCLPQVIVHSSLKQDGFFTFYRRGLNYP
jgi:hypothetical protein